jgi:hypothetical protein
MVLPVQKCTFGLLKMIQDINEYPLYEHEWISKETLELHMLLMTRLSVCFVFSFIIPSVPTPAVSSIRRTGCVQEHLHVPLRNDVLVTAPHPVCTSSCGKRLFGYK